MTAFLNANVMRLGVGLCLLILMGTAVYYFGIRNQADAKTDLLYGRYALAFTKLKNLAERDNASAQNSLGNLYYLGMGVERDYEKAAVWYERAAKNDNKAALVNMGILYFQGRGVKRDLLKSFGWFRLAQRAGRESAETHLKYLSGINLLTPNMIMQAKELYSDIASLTKKGPSELQSFERQPHLGPASSN